VARPKARRTLQEFALIRTLQRTFGQGGPSIVQGMGDDAAVVAANPKTWYILTTDLLAQGVHFDLRTASLESVGYKAAMANLSDLAAMGATPRYCLVSLAAPSGRTENDIHQLYRGMMRACRRHRVRLIGGDTSGSKQGLFVNLTLIGTTPRGRALFRRGARIGDSVYVTGTLGDSRAGLSLLQEPKRKAARQRSTRLPFSRRRMLINRHLYPTARIQEGCMLARYRLASAAIDLSDGLSGDLHHLCEQSHVGAEIELAALPLSPACRAFASCLNADPVQLALSGGEDYELLFTVPHRNQPRLEHLARVRGFRMTAIGRITARRTGVMVKRPDGTRRSLPSISYEHFRRVT